MSEKIWRRLHAANPSKPPIEVLLMDKSSRQGGAISSSGLSRASGRVKVSVVRDSALFGVAVDVPFSDYEYEQAMFEQDLELELELSSRAGETD